MRCNKVIQTAQVMESSQNYPKEWLKPTLFSIRIQANRVLFVTYCQLPQRVGRGVNFVFLLEVKLEISNFWASGACNAMGMAACTANLQHLRIEWFELLWLANTEATQGQYKCGRVKLTFFCFALAPQSYSTQQEQKCS